MLWVFSRCLLRVQPMETGNCPHMTELLLTGALSIEQANVPTSMRHHGCLKEVY